MSMEIKSFNRLNGKVAIVTGGGQGIGKGIVRAMLTEGAKVSLWDIKNAADSAAELEQVGFVMGRNVDVSAGKQVRETVDEVISEWGKIDILVNCAAICPTTPFEEITEEEWDRVLGINLRGTFNCCQAVVSHLEKQGTGNIINFTSQSAKSGGQLAGFHYPASKAGVLCLTISLARLLAPKGIRVNAIAPGIIETEMVRNLSKGDMHGCGTLLTSVTK